MVLIKRKMLTRNIHLLIFKNRRALASTFLRFQEYYESPRFRGKIFTLNEFKQWYTKKYGQWSYYHDWSGFNIPSHVLRPFRQGRFHPLSPSEKKFLSLFRKEKEPFYIAGIAGKRDLKTLKHELAHALFFTSESYRRKVMDILKHYPCTQAKATLLRKGYDKSVLPDELQAYAMAPSRRMPLRIPLLLRNELMKIFEHYLLSMIKRWKMRQ